MQRIVWLAIGSLGFLLHASLASAAARPNIVVVLVDDMGWSDIGCYGSEIPTPHLDALAADGLRFTQFYNTGRCSPTRASLLTGLYPHQAGMGHLDNTVRPGSTGLTGKLAERAVTMGEVLGAAGYMTAISGKWHLGQQHGTPPWERGFQRSLNLPAGGVHFFNQPAGPAKKLYLNGQEHALDDPEFGEWYGADLWTTYGLKFIDEAIAADKPFFLYLAHCAPHFPLMAPAETIAKYRGKYQVGWDVLREQRRARQVEMGLIDDSWPLSPRPAACPAWENVNAKNRDRFDHMMAIYAAMIDEVDKNMGRLIDGLRERGQLDNTLVLFLSDNGGNAESGPRGRTEGAPLGGPTSTVFLGQNWATLNNTPFRRYKHFVHEGGISTPLIAHWPAGLKAPAGDVETFRPASGGMLCDAPAHLIDVMATVVDVGEAQYPREFNGHQILPAEGVSLRPALEGRALVREQPIFFEHEGNRAVRRGQWKLVALNNRPWELYDMQADRTELNNVAEEHPELVAELIAAWDAWAQRAFVDDWNAKPRSRRQNRQAAPAT
ncbi:MAG: arylsulfatase [Planctomycetales bacterium]|nr:arylsulfatase [Planctomycetales bacterium]